MNQGLYELLHRKDGIALTPNQAYLEGLKKRLKTKKIIVISPFGGLDEDTTINSVIKEYDIAWMGRFQNLKGLKDLIEIAQIVKTKRPGTKLLVIGGGTPDEEAAFIRELRKRDLTDTVTYKGFINGSERYLELAKARILAVTSYFESYGIVNIEALKLGLPIVAYDLPTYSHLNEGIIRIKIGNKDRFSAEIVELLNTREKLDTISLQAKVAGQKYSWAATNKQIEELL